MLILDAAHAFIAFQTKFGSFATLLWAYVDGQPNINAWQAFEDVPIKTEINDAISKELKERFIALPTQQSSMLICSMWAW